MPEKIILEKPKVIKSGFSVKLPLAKEIKDFMGLVSEKKYYYWDKVKYIEPAPKNYSREELWFNVKTLRNFNFQKTPVKNITGKNFVFIKLLKFDSLFSIIDRCFKGFVVEGENRARLIYENISEEAIASAQIEGASSTREEAQHFLKKEEKPKNESEQMILNNYNAIEKIRNDYLNKSMSFDLLMEMHSNIAFNMKEEYRLRTAKDKINVVGRNGDIIYHVAPKIDFVKKELENFINFANEKSEIHPILKALILHFWIGYLHPFTDGNGRLARSVFYWSVLKDGYDIFTYLPFSALIKKTPDKYIMSYVYSEQDDCDLTYFLEYNIEQISKSFKLLKEYLKKDENNNKKIELVQKEVNLNKRQLRLLFSFISNLQDRICTKVYMNINQITRKTATTDLKKLVAKKYLIEKKQGVNNFYYPVLENIKKDFKEK